jgi:RNA polymerase sigma-70 factor, ECF subfamily
MGPERTELFVRLLSRHQDDLYRFVFALVPHEEDARDILQETSVALCRKFGEYDAARPFLAWAYQFARLEVLKHRERAPRRVQSFAVELLELLAVERERHDAVLHTRLQALEVCLGKLSDQDRRLIRERYQGRTPTADLAGQSGASRRTLFRTLDRIRRLLHDCIDRQVSAGDPR